MSGGRRGPARVGSRWPLFTALVFAPGISSIALAQRSARGPEVENMRVGFDASISTLKASNSFKIGTWTPVWVQLRGGSERFSGFMDVIVGDDDGTPTSFRMPVEVGANQSQRFTAYARPGSREPEFTIRLLDQDGRRVGGASQATVMPAPPESIMPDETMILTMGRPQGVEMIAELPGFQSANRGPSRNAGEEIVTARIDAQTRIRCPARWYGYDAARAIVVDTGDRETVASLDALRGQALVDWVERGGHLVVAVGANWQAVRDSVLAPILPGLPSGQERVPSLEALDTFAGSNKPITPPGTPAVMVTKLEEVEERGGTVLSVTSNLPLVVRGPYGFGRVTLIALDVDQKPFADWPDRSLFWLRALDLRRPRVDQLGAGSQFGGGGAAVLPIGCLRPVEPAPRRARAVPGREADPVRLGRFLHFPLHPADRAGRLLLPQESAQTDGADLDHVPDDRGDRQPGRVLRGLHAQGERPAGQQGGRRGHRPGGRPGARQYVDQPVQPTEPRLHDPDDPHAARPRPAPGHRGRRSGEPPRAPAGTEVVTTWFSAPENQFGAMGSSSRRFSFGGSGYAYQPTGGVELLENVRIPIWSTKCITSRWFGPAAPLVDSDLQPAGTDRLAGTVTNRQDVPLEDAILAFGKQVYLLGTLAPGATVRVELGSDRNRNLSGYLKDKQKNYLSDQPWNREHRGSTGRLDAGRDVPRQRVDSGQRARPRQRPAPRSGPDRATGPATADARGPHQSPRRRLVLDNAPSPPKIDQLTLVRIILPLKKSKS